MSDEQAKEYRCPHCDTLLRKWQTPPDSSWAGATRLVCFADDCPYFVKGWARMEERQSVRCSYRHMLDPETGYVGPLPVWSKDAHKDAIVD